MENTARLRTVWPTIAASAAVFVATPLMIAASVMIGRTAADTYQTPAWAVAIHLATALPALPLGAYVLLRRKGDRLHRLLGKVWAVLMLITALDTFFIREVTGHLGPLHVFPVITLTVLPLGIWRIRQGDVAGHRKAMFYSYVGLCSAFVFALRPDLRVGHFLFG